jgi:hypothetical protein
MMNDEWEAGSRKQEAGRKLHYYNKEIIEKPDKIQRNCGAVEKLMLVKNQNSVLPGPLRLLRRGREL